MNGRKEFPKTQRRIEYTTTRLLQTICYGIKNLSSSDCCSRIFCCPYYEEKSTTASRISNSKGVSYANAALTTPYQGKMSALRLSNYECQGRY